MAQQKSLIYSFVARGTVILAEYTDFSGNFSSIAAECLQRLPATNNRFTYTCDGHTFNYLVDNGFIYCIVAVESAGRHVSMAFLERIKEDFNKRYGGGKAGTAGPKSLNKDFGPKMKAHMQYCVDHPEESSKLMQVKAQILERGAKVDELVDKTADLRSRIKLIILAIIIILILIIVVSVCGGFSC
ncbi:putative vesicle-associated membrane protein, partial [Cucurbita argyrosperma subsp. argyrosperma]